MMKAGTETGSLANHMYSRTVVHGSDGKPLQPVVGMGVTILMWTDRHAGTVVKVTPTQIHVQRDKATRTDNNGYSENQTYSYQSDPRGEITIFRKTLRGWRSKDKSGLLIGARDEYYDYSF